MKSSFFANIARIINGEAKSNDCTPPSDSHNLPTNSIDKRGALEDAVIDSLKANYAGVTAQLSDRSLVLWIEDGLFYDSLKLGKFQDQLTLSINTELGLSFGSVEITKVTTPPSSATKIMDGCYLQVQSKQNLQKIARAQISSISGMGSLIGDGCVILDSNEIQTLPDCRYNIGVGKNPIIAGIYHRENHIAIDDDVNAEGFAKNRYVSRAHAHIIFSEDYGFMLQVESGGTKAAQKRTHIVRGDKSIELENTMIPEPLQNGDHIILSKNVHLLFKKEQ